MFKTKIKYYEPLHNQSGGIAITQVNCEYFFLLYLDNELNDLEQQEVLQFITENPNTKTLFNNLKDVKLNTDEIKINKSNLYYNAVVVDVTNYEALLIDKLHNETSNANILALQKFIQTNPQFEKNITALQNTILLNDNYNINKIKFYKTANSVLPNIGEAINLLIDDEIALEQKEALLNLASNNKKIAAEILLLQKTKLEKETIIFANKNRLYKKERKPAIPLWIRFSAAACIIFGLSYIFIFKNLSSTKNNNLFTNTIKITNKPFFSAKKNIVIISKENKIQNNKIPAITVKNVLSKKNNVTYLNVARNVKDSNIKNVVLLNNENENTVLEMDKSIKNLITKELQSIAIITMPKPIAVVTNYNTEVKTNFAKEENDLSVFNISTVTINKKINGGKLKQKIQNFLQQKSKSLIGKNITVAGFDIALAR